MCHRHSRAAADVNSQCLWQHVQDLCKPKPDQTPAWRVEWAHNSTPNLGTPETLELPAECETVVSKSIAPGKLSMLQGEDDTFKNVWASQIGLDVGAGEDTMLGRWGKEMKELVRGEWTWSKHNVQNSWITNKNSQIYKMIAHSSQPVAKKKINVRWKYFSDAKITRSLQCLKTV